jgi:hypothetical protein
MEYTDIKIKDEETRKDYHEYFIQKTRTDGKPFFCLVDGAPEDLSELIRSIHRDEFGDCMPNDWIYEIIYNAFEDLSGQDLEDINIEPDCYNKDLIEWFMNPYGDWICNDARQEYGCENLGILEQISCGQEYAKRMIYNTVNNFINEGEK